MTVDAHFAERLGLGKEMTALLLDSLGQAPKKSYAQVYTLNLAMQFRSNLNAVLTLLEHGFDSEAWTVGRSMVEIFIRTKWVQKRKSHAPWIIIGTELRDLNRFSSYKDRSRLRKMAVAEIQQRLDGMASKLSKKGRFWNRKKVGQLRNQPDLKKMAEECGMVKKYRGSYKWGCDHAHSSHKVITRFMDLDAERNWTGRFIVDRPPGDNLSFTSYHILVLALLFLYLLSKPCGWSIDERRRVSIGQKLIGNKPVDCL